MAESNDFMRATEDRSILVQQVLASLGIQNKSLALMWSAQSALYSLWWYWYDGKALEVMTGAKKDKAKFPLKINPIRWVTHKHASGLFGEVAEDNADSLVSFRFRNENGEKDTAADKVAKVIEQIWADSRGAELQAENGIISQVAGGCVFKVSKWPSEPDTSPYRVSTVLPEFFYPIWDSEDKWMLHECIVGYKITKEEAEAKYHVEIPEDTPFVVYSERWTRTTYEIKVNGKVVSITTPQGVRVDGVGPNKYGFVPYIYIPHRYRAGLYYGFSHIPGMIGIAEELNSRMADRGDKIRLQSQDVHWLRNVRNAIKERFMAGRVFLDMGNSMPDGKSTPETGVLESSSIAENAGHQFTTDLWTMIQNESDTPSVAWGQEEGSQRSSASLEVKFWPFLNHIRSERAMWTQGLKLVNKMLIRMMVADGMLPKDALRMRGGVDWAEVLPRERIDKVNEIVQRRAATIISRRNALTQLARGEDVAEELALIEAEEEAARQKQMEMSEHNNSLKLKAEAEKKAASDSD